MVLSVIIIIHIYLLFCKIFDKNNIENIIVNDNYNDDNV